MEAAKKVSKSNAVPHYDAQLDTPSPPIAAHMLRVEFSVQSPVTSKGKRCFIFHNVHSSIVQMCLLSFDPNKVHFHIIMSQYIRPVITIT